MIRAIALIAFLGCLTTTTIMAQQPTFDAASVKIVKLATRPVFGNRGGPGTSDPGRIHLCCIVDATIPPDTTRARYQLMMQQMLRERFRLEIHREKRNFPGYELVIAEGGPKLKESKPDPNAPPDTSQVPKRNAKGLLILPPGPQMFTSLAWGVIIVQVQQKPIGDLMKVMGRMINQSLGENPNDFASPKARVLDRTGLTGTWGFTLRFSCELCQFAATNGAVAPPTPLPADSPGGEPSIFVALRKQLGLKLNRARDVPLDVIVVDRVEKTPTAN